MAFKWTIPLFAVLLMVGTSDAWFRKVLGVAHHVLGRDHGQILRLRNLAKTDNMAYKNALNRMEETASRKVGLERAGRLRDFYDALANLPDEDFNDVVERSVVREDNQLF